ncbi:hypothetical protein ACA910_015625 [Epithemia clementina (nom. ined.)]
MAEPQTTPSHPVCDTDNQHNNTHPSGSSSSSSSNKDCISNGPTFPTPPPSSCSAATAAATREYRRSPTLIRAVSSRYPTTPLTPFWRCVAWSLALVVPSFFYIGPLLWMLPPILYTVVSPTAAGVALILDIVLSTYPHRPWPWFRGLFQLWYDLFDFHHNFMVDPKDHPSQPIRLNDAVSKPLVILAMHPHGIIPIQAFLWMAFCDQYLPSLYGFGATTDVALRIPLLRQVLLWGSAGSASRSVLYRGLTSSAQPPQKSNNLFLLPGGVAEIFLSQPQTHRVKAVRRGLIRLAWQTGAALVPVYVFGGNEFYHSLPQQSPYGWWLERWSRSARAGFTLFWGQYGLPVPYPVKCSMVLGDPIFPLVVPTTGINAGISDSYPHNHHTTILVGSTTGAAPTKSKSTSWCSSSSFPFSCPKVPDPTEEQIDDLLQRYTNALVRLFDQYKAQAGYPNAQLEIC